MDTDSARGDAPLVREYTRGDPRVALQIASDPDLLQDADRRLELCKWAAGGASTQECKEPMQITIRMGGVGFDPQLIMYY